MRTLAKTIIFYQYTFFEVKLSSFLPRILTIVFDLTSNPFHHLMVEQIETIEYQYSKKQPSTATNESSNNIL